MKTSTTIALVLAMALSGSLAAYAQTEQPFITTLTSITITPHHTVHHHFAAQRPESTPAAQRPGEAVESSADKPDVQALRRPGEGDDDGLSRDPDDCMKGCIGGNPQ